MALTPAERQALQDMRTSFIKQFDAAVQRLENPIPPEPGATDIQVEVNRMIEAHSPIPKPLPAGYTYSIFYRALKAALIGFHNRVLALEKDVADLKAKVP